MHVLSYCMDHRLFFLIFEAYEKHAHLHIYSFQQDTISDCINILEKPQGDISKSVFQSFKPKVQAFLHVILRVIFLLLFVR